ncbi:MAG: hypothetical protein GY850_09975 [bacterium]|nr:hypothetical protein [bacterium]
MIPSKRAVLAATALIWLIFAGACSSKPFLIVRYQLPSPSDTLAGKEVRPIVSDLRENKAFLSENAKKSLKQFNETYSLVAIKEDGSGNLLGIYEIDTLISELFKQRLDNLGIRAPSLTNSSEYELEIKLQDFKLDLAGLKWIMKMSYQANLLKDGRLLAMESVSGSAERLKITGKSDAEKLLGELMSDMVNKLEVAKLFQQARN